MRITLFGSSITSAYWNGAATYYRGICRALHQLGHQITFVEQDIYERQSHRDLQEDPDYATVVVCQDIFDLERELRLAKDAQMVVKCSGVGRYDEYLDAAVLGCQGPGTLAAYWDVDAPFTLECDAQNPEWYFQELIPRYDVVLTYGGGPRVEQGYLALGARQVELVYNALDPETHFPVSPDPDYGCDLLFVGNRLPDREVRMQDFFMGAAILCPNHRFLLGGEGWGGMEMPPNVRYIGHVPTGLHNVLNSSARLVLNINRQAMADYGYSPPTRVFEAAGAGACLVTDRWEGVEAFLQPGSEVLVAGGAEEIAGLVRGVSEDDARAIGARALRRVLDQHCYRSRGTQLEAILATLFPRPLGT